MGRACGGGLWAADVEWGTVTIVRCGMGEIVDTIAAFQGRVPALEGQWPIGGADTSGCPVIRNAGREGGDFDGVGDVCDSTHVADMDGH